jgi:hypothetical protein
MLFKKRKSLLNISESSEDSMDINEHFSFFSSLNDIKEKKLNDFLLYGNSKEIKKFWEYIFDSLLTKRNNKNEVSTLDFISYANSILKNRPLSKILLNIS